MEGKWGNILPFRFDAVFAEIYFGMLFKIIATTMSAYSLVKRLKTVAENG